MTEAASVDADSAKAETLRAFREFREYSRGTLDVEHHDVHPVAGLVADDEVREVLMFMAENYSPDREELEAGMPRSFWDTKFARRTVRKYATEVATKAVDEGNLTQTTYLTGLPSYKSDVSGLHAINQLADWLVHSEQCKLVYLAALMGRGKTDLSVTFFEVIHDHYERVRRSLKKQGLDDAAAEVPVPELAANFHVDTPEHLDVEVREISREEDLLEWGEQGSSAEERWFIFDEASTELTAQSGANAQRVAEKMAPFVKKMRKMGINMIVIGHDKGDVHVAIRSLADFVDKTGTKTASFYAGIKKREPTGHLFDLAGIPQTSWGFDTDDTADWAWSDAEEDVVDDVDPLETPEFREWRDERLAMLYEVSDLTYRKLGEAVGVSKDTVGDAVRAHQPSDGARQPAATAD